jgi:hypothetical protein
MSDSAAQENPIAAAAPTTAVTDWLDRHRRIWFAVVALVLVCSFNGQWHLGPDSAGYRQLGHNLATSGRYFFRADIPGVDEYHNEQGTRYPGLPILLAILERLFGQSALPPLIVMMAMAVLSLVLIYRLLLYRLPRWMAVCVIVGVGTNPRFLQYANEILSDMPFLLGVLITLLGFEKVMQAQNRQRLAIGFVWTFAGILIAAAMRPTFIILGAALIVACLWGIALGRVGITSTADQPAIAPASVRWRSAMLIAALILATVVFIGVIDIRSRHAGFLSGGYEERMMSKVENFDNKVAPLLAFNTGELLEDALPMALLGYRSGWGLFPLGGHHLGFGAGFSLIVLISAIGLARRNVFWGMFVLGTVLALIFAGAVPRYFLMILPMLLAGWAMFLHALARQFRSPFAARFVLCFGLFFLLMSNAIASSTFLLIQRGCTRPFDSHRHWQGVHYVGFPRTYDFGRWVGFDHFATEIRSSTSPQDKIIGPQANVLTFLSDRQVYAPVLGHKTRVAGQLFHLAVFPADPQWHQSKEDYELALKQFLRTLRKQQGSVIAGPEANLKLAQLTPIPAHRMTPAQRLERARHIAIRRRRAAAKAARARNATHP